MITAVNVIEERENGITFFEMKNDELQIRVTNLGCHILSIFAKDRDGKQEDVVLGFEEIEDCKEDGTYMGAIVGRVANRIKGASFELNGKTYKLAVNNGPNHLHGGEIGFDQKIFCYEIIENGILFSCISPDMEEGYPGTLELKVKYLLTGNNLTMEYEAWSDEDTPFDFHDYHKIGERINDDCEQLKLASGYDHSFMVKGDENQLSLYDEKSGRKLTVSTTLPAVQIYTGNFLDEGCNGKQGKPYENRDGVAIEPQFLPDSIHIEKEPKVILRKGEIYKATTKYIFQVDEQ